MADKFQTEQETFWAGGFGDEYVERNAENPDFHAALLAKFARILKRTGAISSIIELGANIGLNIRALHELFPRASLSCVEINSKAVATLKSFNYLTVHHASILEFNHPEKYDLVFTSGVLIHIEPDSLGKVYDVLHSTSKRYILMAEYYNPVPVEVTYRGHSGKLFKRDFAGEMLDRFDDLALLDYGFIYHRDNHFPADDATWFLLEKRNQ